MRRLLLIAGDAARGASLGQALTLEGFTVEVAPEGWYALTMLEREPTVLVLVDGAGGSPPAAELAAIVRADRDLTDVRLAVAVPCSEPVPEGFDLVVDGGLPLAEMAAQLRRLADHQERRDEVVLSGALDALDLLHLAETLGHCRRTGRLSLHVPGLSVGELYFDLGRVVHARFGSLVGHAAFVELFATARREVEVSFEFEALRREDVFRYPRTVRADFPKLLLGVAPDPGASRAAGGEEGRRR
ncbi:MAG TPA: DUF4388 domain-containing protein [Thermoanaerobaculia bacterium]